MKYALPLLLLLFAQSAYSACSSTGCKSTVKRFYPFGDGSALYLQIAESNAEQDKMTCTRVENTYVRVMRDHPFFSEYYSALLAATVSDSTVYLRINNSNKSDPCTLIYMTIEK